MRCRGNHPWYLPSWPAPCPPPRASCAHVRATQLVQLLLVALTHCGLTHCRTDAYMCWWCCQQVMTGARTTKLLFERGAGALPRAVGVQFSQVCAVGGLLVAGGLAATAHASDRTCMHVQLRA